MTIWMKLKRVLPPNRDNKWPLALQLIVFLLLEALSSLQAAADPFASYEEAMKPADTLGDILMWVQLIPIFFAMKRWLFCPDTPKEANA